MSTECLINSPNLRVFKRTGTEGCRHDPYRYDEYEIRREGHPTVTIHAGLVAWVQVGKTRNTVNFVERNNLTESTYTLDAAAKHACGYTITKLERFSRKAKERCSKCGKKDGWYEVPGYPGESLLICYHCDHIGGSRFNESAVI